MGREYKKGISQLKNIKNISDLYQEDRNLYYRVLKRAKKAELGIGEFLKELGYNGYKARGYRSNTITDEEIIEELEKDYPSGVVISLSDNRRFYKLLNNRAIEKEMDMTQYMKTLGFKYIYKKKELTLSDEEIIAEIREMYPDGIVISLSSKNPRIYQMIKIRTKDIKKYFKKYKLTYISQKR